MSLGVDEPGLAWPELLLEQLGFRPVLNLSEPDIRQFFNAEASIVWRTGMDFFLFTRTVLFLILGGEIKCMIELCIKMRYATLAEGYATLKLFSVLV